MLALPPAAEIQTWLSVEGLVHEVYCVDCSLVYPKCRLRASPDGWIPGVYGTRSSSYLPRELSDAHNQPITCLWCITGTYRTD